MKQIIKESIDILRKCGYIVETMNTIGDSDDDIDGDRYDGRPLKITVGGKYSGTDYKDWISRVREAVWDCCCGYDISVEQFNQFMEEHTDDIEDAWIVKKWPKEFGRTLFNKYLDEFNIAGEEQEVFQPIEDVKPDKFQRNKNKFNRNSKKRSHHSFDEFDV